MSIRYVKSHVAKREPGYRSLAVAIVEQAVIDYMTDKLSEQTFKEFCLSKWFFVLTSECDGEKFFKDCKKRKKDFT